MTGRWAKPDNNGPARTGSRAWRTLRAAILTRDHGICYVCGQAGANEVDHVTPHYLGGTDHPSNLAAIHDVPCHREKTAREAAAARRQRGATSRRPPEAHPGIT